MDDQEITAHAEARANAQHDRPTQADFDRAEEEIRQMLADGMTYDADQGWVEPEPRVLLIENDMLVCPNCGKSNIVEHAIESEYREVWLANSHTIDGVTYGSLDYKSIDVEDVEPSRYECDSCHTSVSLPEGVA